MRAKRRLPESAVMAGVLYVSARNRPSDVGGRCLGHRESILSSLARLHNGLFYYSRYSSPPGTLVGRSAGRWRTMQSSAAALALSPPMAPAIELRYCGTLMRW
ncbi:hypothetical protein D3C86_1537830 [compost metagenome]